MSPPSKIADCRPPVTRRTRIAQLAALALTLVALLFGSHATAQQPPPAAPGAPDAEKLLGTIVVVAQAQGRPLPKIAVYPSLSADIEDVTLRSVVRRDLDLCGEFELLDEKKHPEGLYLTDSPVDAKAWTATGIEALVRVTGKKAGGYKAELKGQAYFVKKGADPVFEKRFIVPIKDVRVESHRLADLIIGALIGTNGSFAIMNHPNWGPAFVHCAQEWLDVWDSYKGIEIYNGVCEFLPGSAFATDRWDQLLTSGRRVWGFANDDHHWHERPQIEMRVARLERVEGPAEARDPLGARLAIELPANSHSVRIRYRTSPSASALQWLDPAQTSGGHAPFLFSQLRTPPNDTTPTRSFSCR